MHYLLKVIAIMNAAIEAIHALPRLKARAKREQAIVTREAIKLRKANTAVDKALRVYRKADEKCQAQYRAYFTAERVAKEHHDKVHDAELAIAKAVARAVNTDAVPSCDSIDVVLSKLKLDRIEGLLIEAKVAFAKQSVADWKEQVDLNTEALANTDDLSRVEALNNNLCNAIRRMDAAESVLCDMRQQRDYYHQWLERRRMEKEEARIFRKAKKEDLRE